MKRGVVLTVAVLFILGYGVLAFAHSPGWRGGAGGPGYGMGYGMMGPGMMMGPGYHMGWGVPPCAQAANLSPEEVQKRAKAFVEDYISHFLPDYKLEKKGAEEK